MTFQPVMHVIGTLHYIFHEFIFYIIILKCMKRLNDLISLIQILLNNYIKYNQLQYLTSVNPYDVTLQKYCLFKPILTNEHTISFGIH